MNWIETNAIASYQRIPTPTKVAQMDARAPGTVREKISDWRLYLATALFFLAAIPIQIYAVPGFEVTPSLVLAPVALLLFNPRNKIHWAIVGFMAFCGLLAVIGNTGEEGRLRNLLGAASYSSGAPYLLVGLMFAQRGLKLETMWRIVVPVAAAITLILLSDLYLTGGNIVQSAAYQSVSYQAAETTYIHSKFPFYGKYAVITLATIVMVVGGFSIASASAFTSWPVKVAVIAAGSVLLSLSFFMWSRQVMMGVAAFYIILTLLSFRRKETWISLAVFAVLLVPWTYNMQSAPRIEETQAVGTAGVGSNKLATSFQDIEAGNLDEFSTGRLPLYRGAIDRLTPELALRGCGFCNLMDVLKFPISSLHNIALTAIYKGGIVYTVLYLGAAFGSVVLLLFTRRSFARDATIATVVSIAGQSMLNDVLYFQVIPAMLFALTGFALWQFLHSRPPRENQHQSASPHDDSANRFHLLSDTQT